MPSGGATSGDRPEPHREAVGGGARARGAADGKAAAGVGQTPQAAGRRVVDLRHDRVSKAWALARVLC